VSNDRSARAPDRQRISDAGAPLARKGTTLTKEMFLNHLYGGLDEPEIKIIDVFICKMRKKLANASDGKGLRRDGVGAGLCTARAT
jgi:DNA-binding response OmpR family regulator